MSTLVMVDIQADKDAPNKLFAGMGNHSGWLASENLWLAVIQSDTATVRAQMPDYPARLAIGATEIWQKFPEYRQEFVANVIRATPRGPASIERPLKYTIAGDRRVDQTLKLYNFTITDPIPSIATSSEAISVSTDNLGEFQFIDKPTAPAPISILNKFIYFVDNFSFLNSENVEVAPGTTFVSADHILNHSDLVPLLTAANTMLPGMPANWANHGPKMPESFTGAFIFSTENADYAASISSRLLGAAALAGAGYGKVPLRLRMRTGGSEMKGGEQFANRPYIDRSDRYAISIQTEPIKKIIALSKASDLNKFLKAKEDFRLLALDTIEDSRKSDVAVLRFAQIWMAIERLIPFKTETAAQLSLALSALEPAVNRFAKFKALKKSYGLRSQIVHGYSFEKRENIYSETSEMARLFRKLFLISMTASNADELKDLLLDHVASGISEGL